MLASRGGKDEHFEIVKHLVQNCNADIHKCLRSDGKGRSDYEQLIQWMPISTDCCIYFVSILVISGMKTGNALMIACERGNIKVVKLLVETCFSTNQNYLFLDDTDSQGNRLLTIAAAHGHQHIIDYLFADHPERMKLEMHETNLNGDTPFQVACRGDGVKIKFESLSPIYMYCRWLPKCRLLIVSEFGTQYAR
jgi:ankyrin repeat protein